MSYKSNPQLQKFVSLFLAKNAQINLSAIREEEEVWVKHIGDSLIVADLLQNCLIKRAGEMPKGMSSNKEKRGGGAPVIPDEGGVSRMRSGIQENELREANFVNIENNFLFHLDSVSRFSQTSSMEKLARNDGRIQVLDLGTGGGFPGLPLAIMFPDIHFTLLDATRKKIDCIREFAEQLGLTNVTPQWGRAVDMRAATMKEERKHNKNGIMFLDGAPSTSQRYDLIVTRATAYIDDLFTWIKPLLKSDGRAWLYKQASEEEWEAGQQIAKNRGFTLEKILTYELAGQERWILEITREKR